MSKILKIFFIVLIAIIVLIAAFVCYFFMGQTKAQDSITWGVDFSQSQAEYLKLNWKDLYMAMITDLKVKNIKLHTNWDWVEGKKDNFYFNDIDWQVKQAEQNNVKIIYVIGMKTGRWPECHMPAWTEGMPEAQVKSELLAYMTQVVQRYKNSKAISYWQVENEPLFNFGECPSWYYQNDDFLKTEVALVKSLDPSRQIIVSDSGEQSTWFDAAKIGDIVGITMYRNAWAHVTDTFGFNMYSFLDPMVYEKKAQLIKKLYGKDVICIELQAEPWTSKPLMQSSVAEESKSMNPNMFEENINFAEQTGFDKFYFWGVEWWYWMKTTQNQPAIWNEAKQLFAGQ